MEKVYLLKATTTSEYDDCGCYYDKTIGIYSTKEKATQAEKELQLRGFNSFEEKEEYVNKRNSVNSKNLQLNKDRDIRFSEYCKEREKYYNDVFKKQHDIHYFFDGCFSYPYEEKNCNLGFKAWASAPSGRGFGNFEPGEHEQLKKQCWTYLKEFNKNFPPFEEPVYEEFDDNIDFFEGETTIEEYVVQ
jgi:hypothetical protein